MYYMSTHYFIGCVVPTVFRVKSLGRCVLGNRQGGEQNVELKKKDERALIDKYYVPNRCSATYAPFPAICHASIKQMTSDKENL